MEGQFLLGVKITLMGSQILLGVKNTSIMGQKNFKQILKIKFCNLIKKII
jgi:hypothetical protein